jgi:hypothetical protein
MLTPERWITNGIWGDANTPDLSFQQTPIFGVRHVAVSLAEAYEALGKIGSAVLDWSDNLPDYTGIELFTRLNGESDWNRVGKKGFVPGVNGNLGNPGSRSVEIKILLRATMSEIDPANRPELTELILTVYGWSRGIWQSQNLVELAWKE